MKLSLFPTYISPIDIYENQRAIQRHQSQGLKICNIFIITVFMVVVLQLTGCHKSHKITETEKFFLETSFLASSALTYSEVSYGAALQSLQQLADLTEIHGSVGDTGESKLDYIINQVTDAVSELTVKQPTAGEIGLLASKIQSPLALLALLDDVEPKEKSAEILSASRLCKVGDAIAFALSSRIIGANLPPYLVANRLERAKPAVEALVRSRTLSKEWEQAFNDFVSIAADQTSAQKSDLVWKMAKHLFDMLGSEIFKVRSIGLEALTTTERNNWVSVDIDNPSCKCSMGRPDDWLDQSEVLAMFAEHQGISNAVAAWLRKSNSPGSAEIKISCQDNFLPAKLTPDNAGYVEKKLLFPMSSGRWIKSQILQNEKGIDIFRMDSVSRELWWVYEAKYIFLIGQKMLVVQASIGVPPTDIDKISSPPNSPEWSEIEKIIRTISIVH